MGLEACVTLGMLDEDQATQLSEAGLDYYNHNLDTSPEYYQQIITTRSYQDRLDTLAKVRDANINVCCGGIVGMGESREDRVRFLLELVQLPVAPESIPINKLIAVPGTPLENTPELDDIEFVRVIAAARIIMPKSVVRISAGRESMPNSTQALCFMAGANSIFLGDKLLTAANATEHHDHEMMKNLGLRASA
jgi:biotin synthase